MVLVERDAPLLTLSDLLAKTAAGRGTVVLISGEAGVGKSALARAAVTQAGDRLAVRRGACDDLTTAAALGPVLEAVPELAELAARDAEQHVLLRSLHNLFATGPPTLLLLEDLHWADGATLDALRYLGRRIADVPLLVIATYREEGVVGQRELQRLLGELTSAQRIGLAPLTADGVAQLVDAATAATVDAIALHADTGGNPFYVTEVLASGSDEMPATVRDAVLARTAQLSDGAHHALAAVAVLGRAPVAVITAVGGGTEGDVDECFRNGVLGRRRHGVHLSARARSPGGRTARWHRECVPTCTAASLPCSSLRAPTTVASRITPPPAATPRVCCVMPCGPATARHVSALIARLLSSIRPRCSTAPPMSISACSCFRHAPTSATSPTGSTPRSTPDCACSNSPRRPVTMRPRATRCAGCRACRGTSAATPTASAMRQRAVDTLTPLGDSSALAMAISNVAQLRMLGGDNAAAIEAGRHALSIARGVGDRDTEIHALNNIGTATYAIGETVEGAHLLARSFDLALAADAHEHAARAFTNLCSLAVNHP